MTKVLILVLSANMPPYGQMITNSLATWDSVNEPNMETVYYCGNSHGTHPSEKVIYLPVEEGLFNLGHKCIAAFEYALKEKDFTHIARVHSSIYVDKKRLAEYVETLPKENLFAGVEADSQNGFRYCWGGVGTIWSRDVVQKAVDNKHLWQHQYMEDESASLLVSSLGIPFYPLYSSGIDKMPDGWRCISYNGESISFTDFAELNRLRHHYYRIKVDGNREQDGVIMNKLFAALK